MTFTTPETRIIGLLMGDRILNYSGTLIIKDFNNKIESLTSFPFKLKYFLTLRKVVKLKK